VSFEKCSHVRGFFGGSHHSRERHIDTGSTQQRTDVRLRQPSAIWIPVENRLERSAVYGDLDAVSYGADRQIPYRTPALKRQWPLGKCIDRDTVSAGWNRNYR
jgi:hypothetical protein